MLEPNFCIQCINLSSHSSLAGTENSVPFSNRSIVLSDIGVRRNMIFLQQILVRETKNQAMWSCVQY